MYDSDTILLTDNQTLIAKAKQNYEKFKVPTNFVESKKTQRYYTWEHKADLDIKTSVNKIGEIINLSQQLNSLLWDRVNNGATIESQHELYLDICKLAVLSNVEIDRAKKEFVIEAVKEIALLKEKYKIVEHGKTVKPVFFKMITTENGYELSDRIHYRYFDTSMDYLQKVITSNKFRKGRKVKEEFLPFMDVVKEPDISKDNGYRFNQRNKVIEIVRKARMETKKLYIDYQTKSPLEKQIIIALTANIKQQCIADIEKLTENEYTMYLTLKELDRKDSWDVARYMFEVLFGKPNESFFKMIEESKEDLYQLVEDVDGDIQIYDFKYKKVSRQELQDDIFNLDFDMDWMELE